MCRNTVKESPSSASLGSYATDDDQSTTPSYRKYKFRKSTMSGLINWTHVFTTYVPQLLLIAMSLLVALICRQVVTDLMERQHIESSIGLLSLPKTMVIIAQAVLELLKKQSQSVFLNLRKENLFSPAVEGCFVVIVVLAWIITADNPVYLLSFSTFKAPESWRCTHDEIMTMMRRQQCFTEESLSFMRRLLDKSATGQSTAWPPCITDSLREKDENGEWKKYTPSIEDSRQEAEIVIFTIVEDALRKAKLHPKDVDVLVINCSLFSPTPSLCASVISHFKMRGDILSYNLSGMGCGASLLALDLGKQMLQRRRFGGKALIVSTEIISPNLYLGNEKGFLLQNTLFRCGGSAMVLSNNLMDGRRAWFKLLHNVRVQHSTEDAFQCVYETEDKIGRRGVRLSKEIVKVAGKTMEKNLTTMGPYVLPITEQAKVVISLLAKFVMKKCFGKRFPVYVPDFKRGVDHFCIHAGGRAVIEGIEKNLSLEKYHSEASRMTLLNYGNTSSSSIWYELEYLMNEQKSVPLQKGDRVLQIAFGSGFKCCSGVWLKL